MKFHKPKTIEEAINDLWMFLDADMYTKFRPEVKIGKKKMYREDVFIDENEFSKYLEAHFKILKNQIRRLNGKKQKTKRS